MTLKDIDFILELAQTQNFNRAAENLYTAQPTFSYHIKAAEEELGFQIFTRTSKGATLHPLGHNFVPHYETSGRNSKKRLNRHKISAHGIQKILR